MTNVAPRQFVEEGEAFKDLARLHAVRERFDVVVIGAGQAGLSVGYHLAKKGIRFLILDANERVGDVWRSRWDSLRLFTPAKFDGLDGMPFPGPPNSFPTKDEMADYLESYAKRFGLPVRTGTRVESLSRGNDRYLVKTARFEVEADQVIVAMSNFQKGKVPAYASELRPDIVQIHSVDYKNPAQLQDGPVLIPGAGNSGAEIAMDLAKEGHDVCMSGRDVGEVPFRMEGFAARFLLARLLLRFFFHRVLTIRTPIGRRRRAVVANKGAPLIRVKRTELAARGVKRVARIAGVRDGLPLLENGTVLDVANIVWCTGFNPGFSWIELPVFGEDGVPVHDGGVVTSSPGLYFVGLHFLYAFSSVMIHGVGRDAARIAGLAVARAAVGSGASLPRLEASTAG